MNSERKFAEEIKKFVEILKKEKEYTNGKYSDSTSEAKNIITKKLPDILKEISNKATEYPFYGLVGSGSDFASTPWLAIYDKKNLHDNFYVQYVFTENFKGFYLTLNIPKKSAEKSDDSITSRFNKYIKENIENIPEDMKKYGINLETSNNKGRIHKNTCILNKYYDIDNLPDDSIFADDFNNMIGILVKSKNLITKELNKELNRDSYILTMYLVEFIYKKVPNIDYEEEINLDNKNQKNKQKENKECKRTEIRETYIRDEKLVKDILKENNYTCEFDENHKTFIINETTNEQYMEAHHLIPMKEYERYKENIDVRANLCCICPNCHRLLHHGLYKDKEAVLKKLHTKKEILLKDAGLEISLKELKAYYKKTF